jgi:hypothetical protein
MFEDICYSIRMLEYRFGNQFFPWLECMFFLIFTIKKNDNGNCEPW